MQTFSKLIPTKVSYIYICKSITGIHCFEIIYNHPTYHQIKFSILNFCYFVSICIPDWDRVVTGILSSPDDADGVDTFDFGQIFDWSHDQCEAKCEQQAGCVAYSQFPTWYPNSDFFAACVGRSSTYDVLEPDSDVLSGVFTGIYVDMLIKR